MSSRIHKVLAADVETVPHEVAEANTRLQALEQLVHTAENRLDESGHARRVGELSGMLAQKIGMLEDEVSLIRQAAPLHDVGIIGIPDRILLKPGRLTGDEFAHMRRHVDIGSKMLSYGDSEVLDMAKMIAKTHHERIDGSGYPNHLKGDNIPVAGQIVALVDFFDTLTRRRPYRAAYAIEEALNKVKRRAGTEFNPMLVTAFMRSLTEARQRLQDKARSPKEFRMQGSVDTDTLFDLLLSLAHNRKSGRLGLYLGFSEALLYVHEGQVIHAEYEGESGEAAVAKLVVQAQRYVQMDFVLEPWEFDGDVHITIEIPLQRLLLSSAVAVDEQLAAN